MKGGKMTKMEKRKIDLNSDIGESFGVYKIGQDEEILPYISSANIACGFHAGDYNVMNKTVKMAIDRGVAIGAHPGMQDLTGFGRREMAVSADEVYNMIIYQMNALKGFTHIHGGSLHHVKPHGALYNMAATNIVIAEAIAKAIYDTDAALILYGLANSELIHAGKKYGLHVAEEIFADRTYQSDGTLSPRNFPDAVIHDKNIASAQIKRMIEDNLVTTVDGTEIPIHGDTVCVHGDGIHALNFVQHLTEMFQEAEIKIESVSR